MILIVLLLSFATLAVLSGWDWGDSLPQSLTAIQTNLLDPDFNLTLDFSKRAIVTGTLLIVVLTMIIARISRWWSRRKLPDFLRDL